jgi:hypothetical protein
MKVNNDTAIESIEKVTLRKMAWNMIRVVQRYRVEAGHHSDIQCKSFCRSMPLKKLI